MVDFIASSTPDGTSFLCKASMSNLVIDSIKSKIEVDKDIFLYTYKNKPGTEFFIVYEIEAMMCCSGIHFVLDFEGSMNLSLLPLSGETFPDKNESDQNLQLHADVIPFQRRKLGQINLLNPNRRAILKYKYSWTRCELISKEGMNKLSLQQKKFIAQELKSTSSLLPLPPPARKLSNALSPLALKQLFINHKHQGLSHFVDQTFPPNEESLQPDQPDVPPLTTTFPVVWNQPSNFMNGPYELYADGISPADIRQGYLADCWLLCAIASLAEFPCLIEGLFPKSNEITNDFGCYEVRLCNAGQWVTVTLDDFFPCYPVQGGGPVFSQSHGCELWVLLLEKAFAKMRGSYANLRYGYSLDALVDLTGAPFLHINLALEQEKDGGSSLWEQILAFDRRGYVMSGSTAGRDESSEGQREQTGQGGGQGLVLGHAYTVLEARETRGGDRLLKLRNPWGTFEWTGDWSDDSPRWTPELLQELDYALNILDGTFWMSFLDFLQYFVFFEVCMTRAWTELRKKLWVSLLPPSLTEGGVEGSSPRISCMYILHLSGETSTEVVFSIHQPNKVRSESAGSLYLDIGVTVLRVETDGSFTFACSSGVAVERQMQACTMLDPGVYVVIPMTSGAKLRQYQQMCQERKGSNPKCLLGDNKDTFSDEVDAVYDEIFDRFDTDGDKLLTKVELDFFMTISNEGNAIDDNVYRWLISNFDSCDGGLTRRGFKQAQMYMYKASGCDDTVLWKDLFFMGYDRQLHLVDTEIMSVVCHSESNAVSLKQIDFDKDAFDEACDGLARRDGSAKILNGDALKLHISEAGTNLSGVSLSLENIGPLKLVVEVDCSKSINTISHRGRFVHCAEVWPGEVVLFHLLFPENMAQEWSWKYEVIPCPS